MTHKLDSNSKILNGDQITLPSGEYNQVQYVTAQFVKGKMPASWKDFQDGESNWAALPPEDAKRMTEQLKCAIVNGEVRNLWMSFDSWGEDYSLNADFEKGWAALLFQACDESAAAPFDPDRPDGKEDAPVEIGGQTPVPKMCALEDLEKTAQIILYFLETGKLHPKTKWAINKVGGLPWDMLGSEL